MLMNEFDTKAELKGLAYKRAKIRREKKKQDVQKILTCVIGFCVGFIVGILLHYV